MKRIVLSVFAFTLTLGLAAQCDPSAHDFMDAPFGVSPDPNVGEDFAPAFVGVDYSDVVYVKVPTSAADIDETYPESVLIDSLRLEAIFYLTGEDTYEDINGLGLSVTCNNNGESDDPCMFFPSGQYCGDISGVPTVEGSYPTRIDVTVYITAFGVSTSIPYSFENYTFNIGAVSVAEPVAVAFDVKQNTPNPASSFTEISFDMPNNGVVDLVVTNLVGRKISEKKIQAKKGTNSMKLDVSGYESGIYLYSIQTGDKKITKRMMVQN
ncbi:MAG: hypothetical protein RL220_1689 [Bacteroidota bacterium]